MDLLIHADPPHPPLNPRHPRAPTMVRMRRMDLVDLGPVRAHKIVKTSGTTPKNAEAPPLTVVLMHGYGAPGDDLVSLAGALDAPKGTTFLFPEAPSMVASPALMSLLGDARAWWPIDIERFQ